jgi:fructosamine-3-kinase
MVAGSVRRVVSVGGGCIHPAARIELDGGGPAFVKWSERPGPAGFGVEARGLTALGDRGGVAVPEVLGFNEGGEGRQGWLLLAWIEPGPESPTTARRLGAGLAHLHRPLTGGEPAGWTEDGWIATLRQPNPPTLDWPGFWATARLEPMWRRARNEGHLDGEDDPFLDRLLGAIDRALAGWEEDGLSLLHGDLWSGNVLVGPEEIPYLVDPAVYRGHREVDLAMTELFGGFSRGFGEAYRDAAPLVDGYEDVRRAVYQLYPLLVHVNLFGGGYVHRTVHTLREVMATLGMV